MIEYEYVNAVCLKIQDDEAYGELEQLDVLVFDELTTNVRPGELVKITGRMEILKNSNKNTYGSLFPVLFAKGLEYRRREEQAVIAKDVKSFANFAKMPNVVDRLVTMFAPDVIGHKDKKISPTNIRSRRHRKYHHERNNTYPFDRSSRRCKI
jgi:DNA replicative helicase MCM subunit Mcm2 (Cdc46/Mcm family)